jgi:hypothetical protein
LPASLLSPKVHGEPPSTQAQTSNGANANVSDI